jgi:hypothetical protein
MTKPKPWPRNAAYARDDAIMEAAEAIENIQPVLNCNTSRDDLLRVMAKTIYHLYKIISLLKALPPSNDSGRANDQS